MDEAHLIAAARYVALNPVRARLVARAEDWLQNWPWSSVRAHLAGEDDEAAVRPLLDRIGDFAELLRTEGGEEARAVETTGRPPPLAPGSTRRRVPVRGRSLVCALSAFQHWSEMG